MMARIVRSRSREEFLCQIHRPGGLQRFRLRFDDSPGRARPAFRPLRRLVPIGFVIEIREFVEVHITGIEFGYGCDVGTSFSKPDRSPPRRVTLPSDTIPLLLL